MAKKTHVKVRLVPEAKPDSPFFYYVKKPAGGEKAKIKLSAKSPFIGAELAIKSKYLGLKVSEVGIHTYPRTFGSGSSVSLKNIFLTIKDMFKMYFNFKNF